MLGLDKAGKTTLLYQLKLGETVKTIPTVGFNYETLDYKGCNLAIWDVGGQEKIRGLWKHYYQKFDGLIFVVDSSDKNRIDEAAEELKKILDEDELKGCPVLVYANKQDLNGALSLNEVTDKMGMGRLKGRQWLVQGCCANDGRCLKEGLDWLVGVLLKKK